LAELAKIVTAKGLNLIIYTGYRVEELLEMGRKQPAILELMGLADLLVDGRFVLAERDLNLLFRGSRNQRVIDAKESLRRGEAVETEFPN